MRHLFVVYVMLHCVISFATDRQGNIGVLGEVIAEVDSIFLEYSYDVIKLSIPEDTKGIDKAFNLNAEVYDPNSPSASALPKFTLYFFKNGKLTAEIAYYSDYWWYTGLPKEKIIGRKFYVEKEPMEGVPKAEVERLSWYVPAKKYQKLLKLWGDKYFENGWGSKLKKEYILGEKDYPDFNWPKDEKQSK